MYLSHLDIENFRIFGSEDDVKSLSLDLRPGLNVLVGENDSGKTAIIDAVRLLLWTTSYEYNRITEDDFHVEKAQRATELSISATFAELSQEEIAAMLEWLTVKKGEAPVLHVALKATLSEDEVRRGRGRVSVVVRSGQDARGPALEGTIREDMRTTYLKPLRDAEQELSSGRGSRLSQILVSHPNFKGQEVDDYAPSAGTPPKTLVGIMRQAERAITKNPVVAGARDAINDDYLDNLSLANDPLLAGIGVARKAELRDILERLELSLDSPGGVTLPTRRGLGHNNVLFMATELLLLSSGEKLPLLLFEEPEAHLHPQMQLRLMEFLQTRCARAEGGRVQVLLTTHSPNLASKAPLDSMILVSQGSAHPLSSEHTKLAASDYRFLERFLDATRANLFFAKAVVIVEGDAENILLPAIAETLGRPFHKFGVSIVNVGHTGFFRYARIFQRSSGEGVPIRVACVADKDIPPDEASDYLPPKRKTASDYTGAQVAERIARLKRIKGDPVEVFVSAPTASLATTRLWPKPYKIRMEVVTRMRFSSVSA